MSIFNAPDPEWNPHAQSVREDLLAACDHMRKHRPVAYHDELQWYVFRHADVLRVIEDHQTFSNAVSTHLSVPNGMDPPEHSKYRPLIESFFEPAAMAGFEPQCRALSRKLLASVVPGSGQESEPEVMSAIAQRFALRVQCTFLGWPDAMEQTLGRWFEKNQVAIRERDRESLAANAAEFSAYIESLLRERREAVTGSEVPDVTSRLLRSEVMGRPLTDDEIVSILRNWTAGEVGTIAASVGILLHFIAAHPELQRELRDAPEKLPEAIDEILRIHGPLVSNRRKATCPAHIGEHGIGAGERVSVLWVSANRDEEAFEDAKHFRWGRDQSKNLLYGAGVHVCPGAPLARLELRVIMEEILAATTDIRPGGEAAQRAEYPASGYARLPLVFAWR